MTQLVHQTGDTYKITGVLRNGSRFRAKHYSSPHMALAINLWQGNVWQRKAGIGRWRVIKSVIN